ncbi:MAG: stage II sporulation protein D [Ruminococcaceae bacterium]|nr:stage II sporulation protein D [Oscillospiraceae bacterium]
MRRSITVAWLLLAITFLLPLLLVHDEPLTRGTAGEELLPLYQTGAVGQTDGQQMVSVLLEDGSVEQLTLADYLWGVVAAEMPASFELEALKAQTVAARTYWLSQSGASRHEGADICADSGCCQAYISRDEARTNWGDKATEYGGRIAQAVAQTDGLCVTYEGKPIQALFFSSAPGSTVDAQAVWGRALPYLVSVDSPEGEEVPNYRSQLTITTGEFRALVAREFPGADLTGPVSGWLSDFVWEPSGTVSRVKVGGVSMTGGQVRKLLGLRSACFSVSVRGEEMTFHVTGYGHGVGMSQYGANAMARQGKSFRDILGWYYTGTQVTHLA